MYQRDRIFEYFKETRKFSRVFHKMGLTSTPNAISIKHLNLRNANRRCLTKLEPKQATEDMSMAQLFTGVKKGKGKENS
jgi:hypothetical protein